MTPFQLRAELPGHEEDVCLQLKHQASGTAAELIQI